MNTGRKLSHIEQQDVARYLVATNLVAMQALSILWGDDWFFHISSLADEMLGKHDTYTAVHL